MNFFANLRNVLVHDLGWKVLSVVLAGAIWFTVHRNLVESSLVLSTAQPSAEMPATNSLLHLK